LYRGPAAVVIEEEFPGVVVNGAVDRRRLGGLVLDDPAALARLEAIVHPLVFASRDAFLAGARRSGLRLVVLDVPLLFETAGERDVDAVVLVSAPESVQKARVSQRPGMTPERLAVILARQMPDVEKRARSHFVIDTSLGLDIAQRQARGVLRALAGASGHARHR
jgi:dephospho-CoA kinase